jgi:hypothetical protein
MLQGMRLVVPVLLVLLAACGSPFSAAGPLEETRVSPDADPPPTEASSGTHDAAPGMPQDALSPEGGSEGASPAPDASGEASSEPDAAPPPEASPGTCGACVSNAECQAACPAVDFGTNCCSSEGVCYAVAGHPAPPCP